MNDFRFVHAADLHIDSPFKGVTAQSKTVAEALQNATLQAFDNIVDLCIDSEADFLIVAGDVYDGADRNIQPQLAFYDGLKRLADKGIRSFVIHGNHDPLGGWAASLDWPDAVTIFASRVESYTFEKGGHEVATLAGISYQNSREDRNLARLLAASDSARRSDLFQIAVLHCNVGGDKAHANYAPCSLDELIGHQFDYWALGHVHERKVMCQEPWVVYPGNSQGRSVRETGARGCYLVEVSGKRSLRLEFMSTDCVRWMLGEVDVSSIGALNQLEQSLCAKAEELAKDSQGRPIICRLGLVGRSSLYHEMNDPQRLQDLTHSVRAKLQHLKPFVWVESIDFDCRPQIDIEQAREREDLLGFVLKEGSTIAQCSNLSAEVSELLKPLFQTNALGRSMLSMPSDTELKKLLEEAELACIDLLENG
jgi:DNA repair exonuclease SbcCD nuclease subunit